MRDSLLGRWFRGTDHKSLLRQLKMRPNDVAAWVKLINVCQQQGMLDEQHEALVRSHELQPGAYVVATFADTIAERGAAAFQRCAEAPIQNLSNAIDEIVKWKTALQCGHTHDVSKGYFVDAEPVMALQWDKVIYPLIQDLDFTCVLDLACGHGRNTEFLRRFSKEMHLVDINASCIDACRERFGEERDGTRFNYYVTDGNHVRMLPDDQLTLAYTWDSMVHFDKLIVRDYVRDVARALKPGGCAFLHHSNYGAVAPDSNWASNPGTRSDMSAELMREYAAAAGLDVVRQKLQGRAEGWGMDDLDCVSILRKP